MADRVDRRPSVLLVDDCGDQRDLYHLLLTSEFDVMCACRGQEAIVMAGVRKPHVIVLDIQMPDMDGFETCRRLKRSPETAAIPVIMLTGTDYIPDEARFAGAFAVLEKPCPDRKLVEAIGSAIAGQAG